MVTPFLAAISEGDQPTNQTDPSIGIAVDDFPCNGGRFGSLQVHVGVDEVDQCPVGNLVDDLIAIGSSTPVFTAPYELHFVAELTYDVGAVVGGGVIEHEHRIVLLRQYLREQPAQVLAHVVVRNGRND